MKKIVLFAVLFTFLAINLSNSFAVSNTPSETSITGILNRIEPGFTGNPEDSFILGETGYLLRLDKPIIFHEGSKSERVVKVVRLNVPTDLKEKAEKLEGQHVVATGKMDCTMHYSPWGASCDMTVERITKFGEAAHRGEVEELLGISVNLKKKEVTIKVVSTGCTNKNDFIFEVKDNILTIIRTRKDTCKAMPSEASLTFSFKEIGIDPHTDFKIANSFLTGGYIWQK